jgi:hypothetical protein
MKGKDGALCHRLKAPPKYHLHGWRQIRVPWLNTSTTTTPHLSKLLHIPTSPRRLLAGNENYISEPFFRYELFVLANLSIPTHGRLIEGGQ